MEKMPPEENPVVYELDEMKGEVMHIGEGAIKDAIDEMEKNGSLKKIPGGRETMELLINGLPFDYQVEMIAAINAANKAKKEKHPGGLH